MTESNLVDQAQEHTNTYLPRIDSHRPHALNETHLDAYTTAESKSLPVGEKYRGKVRDVYTAMTPNDNEDCLVVISTDRQSAFDRNLANIPYKGQVLNLTSTWWFEKTKELVPNHLLNVPHPNVTVGKKCTVFPVEFIMRGYVTGSTSTSLWTNYNKGVRHYCGHDLPDGLVKNQKLESNLLTPTTKDTVHDELISAEEIVSSGRMSQEDWDTCAAYSMNLFDFGQRIAAERGLILVDTKYEFGKDASGNIVVIDEIHTPDSSRYWIAGSYEDRMKEGKDPENIDKEFLRLWFREHCDPYKDEVLPEAPVELVNELSRRYIMLYELITGETFQFPPQDQEDDSTVLNKAMEKYFEAK